MKLRKDWTEWVVCLVALVAVSGCSGSQLGGLFSESDDYRLSIEATKGPVLIPPTTVGIISVPRIGVGLLPFAATFVGENLAEKHDLDACRFESYGARLEGQTVIASASAFCRFNNREVEELLTIKLEPVA